MRMDQLSKDSEAIPFRRQGAAIYPRLAHGALQTTCPGDVGMATL